MDIFVKENLKTLVPIRCQSFGKGISKSQNNTCKKLGGAFKEFFMFTPKIGEDSQFDSYYSKGLKPPTRKIIGALISCE